MRNKLFFTLLELLIVIGIIGILVSILMPSLVKARDKVKYAVCCSNMSQNYKAQYMSLKENKGRFLNKVGAAPQNYAGKHGWGPSSKQAPLRPVNFYLYGRKLQNGEDAPVNICPMPNGKPLYDVIGNSYSQNCDKKITNSTSNGNAVYLTSIQEPVRMVFLYEWAAHHVLYKPGGYDNKWSLPLHGREGEYSFVFVDGHIKGRNLTYPGSYTQQSYTFSNGQ